MKKTIKTLSFRRKREEKTDYKRRLALLKSGKDRIVIRIKSNQVISQIVRFEPEGDKVLAASKSRELKKLGSTMKGNNLPSCYLVGLNLGMKAKKAKLDNLILDTGLRKPIKGGRIYAVLKGVLDAGINVPHSDDVLPSEDRVSGKHITEYAKSLGKKSDAEKIINDLKVKIAK